MRAIALYLVTLLTLAFPVNADTQDQIVFDPYARGLGGRLIKDHLQHDPSLKKFIADYDMTPVFSLAYIDLDDDGIQELLAFFNDDYYGICLKNTLSCRLSIYKVVRGVLKDIGGEMILSATLSDNKTNGYKDMIIMSESGEKTLRWNGESYVAK
jgi:hypothetical protein